MQSNPVHAGARFVHYWTKNMWPSVQHTSIMRVIQVLMSSLKESGMCPSHNRLSEIAELGSAAAGRSSDCDVLPPTRCQPAAQTSSCQVLAKQKQVQCFTPGNVMCAAQLHRNHTPHDQEPAEQYPLVQHFRNHLQQPRA